MFINSYKNHNNTSNFKYMLGIFFKSLNEDKIITHQRKVYAQWRQWSNNIRRLFGKLGFTWTDAEHTVTVGFSYGERQMRSRTLDSLTIEESLCRYTILNCDLLHQIIHTPPRIISPTLHCHLPHSSSTLRNFLITRNQSN